jgi:GNAT superfamily N-acetyltransferase
VNTWQPPIPGLVFREYRGEEDLPAIVALSNACLAADGIETVDTVEGTAGRFRASHNFDPGRDAFIVEIDGAIVAFGRMWWRIEHGGTRIFPHVGGVHPAWRGRGIGRTLLHRKEQRVREIAAAQPVGNPWLLHAFVADTETAYQALLRDEGYAPVRYAFEMVRPMLDALPDAPLPDGLVLRAAHAEHYRAIWEAIQEAFRDHWGSFPTTEWHYQQWLNDPNFDPALWRVAWDGDQIAGVTLGEIRTAENRQYHRARVDRRCGRAPPVAQARPGPRADRADDARISGARYNRGCAGCG